MWNNSPQYNKKRPAKHSDCLRTEKTHGSLSPSVLQSHHFKEEMPGCQLCLGQQGEGPKPAMSISETLTLICKSGERNTILLSKKAATQLQGEGCLSKTHGY